MTQKICFDCFHRLFPDKPVRKVTLGRQCVVCKAQTDRTEQMIPVEAEDIPLVKQISQVPRAARIDGHLTINAPMSSGPRSPTSRRAKFGSGGPRYTAPRLSRSS